MKTKSHAHLSKIGLIGALALTVTTGSLFAQTFGAAHDYNVFVREGFDLINSDVEGRAAVGGNLKMQNSKIGDSLGQTSSIPSLVVGGNAQFENSNVKYGDVHVGGNVNYVNNPNQDLTVVHGSLNSGNPIDFNGVFSDMTALSNDLKSQGGASHSTGVNGLVFTGTDSNLNSFIIDSSNFGGGMTVDAPAGSTVVITVLGTNINWGNGEVWLEGGVDANHVLYNFPDAQSLNMSSVGPWGSILAPNADVNFFNGQLNGTLIANSVTGSEWVTGEFHHFPFQGNIDPIPEPASALLGAIGTLFLLRRRR